MLQRCQCSKIVNNGHLIDRTVYVGRVNVVRKTLAPGPLVIPLIYPIRAVERRSLVLF